MALRTAAPRRPSPADATGNWSEAEFQRRVIVIARDAGWGISIAAWRSLNEELAAYGQPPDPLGGLVFHPRFSVGSEPGWPDLVFIRRRDRRLMFRELKTDKGRVTDRQAAVLELLAACGLDAGVWRPADMERIGRELL